MLGFVSHALEIERGDGWGTVSLPRSGLDADLNCIGQRGLPPLTRVSSQPYVGSFVRELRQGFLVFTRDPCAHRLTITGNKEYEDD